MGVVASTLSPEEVAEVTSQANLIGSSARLTIGEGQFTFFANFDGTNNNRENLALSDTTQPTNVGQIFDQYPAQSANGVRRYYPGVGTGGATGGGFDARSFNPTPYVLATAESALGEFAVAANAWLQEDPSRTVADLTAVLTGFSRGAGTAIVFAQLLNERGLVLPNGEVVAPPGAVPVSAAILFDPVVTGISVDMTLPGNVQDNVVVVQAMDEFRAMFPAADFSNDPRVRTIKIYGNHGDIGGFYDRGIGALVLEGSTEFLVRSGVGVVPVPTHRQFDSSSPPAVHTEGIDSFGNPQWTEYGTRGNRLLKKIPAPLLTSTPSSSIEDIQRIDNSVLDSSDQTTTLVVLYADGTVLQQLLDANGRAVLTAAQGEHFGRSASTGVYSITDPATLEKREYDPRSGETSFSAPGRATVVVDSTGAIVKLIEPTTGGSEGIQIDGERFEVAADGSPYRRVGGTLFEFRDSMGRNGAFVKISEGGWLTINSEYASVTGPDGSVTRILFDHSGVAVGVVTRRSFDDGSSTSDLQFPEGRSIVSTYDSSGALFRREMSSVKGVVTETLRFDGGGRLIAVVSTQIDDEGNKLVVLTDSSGTTTRTYDEEGQIIAEGSSPADAAINFVSQSAVLQDITGLVAAITSGKPLPIAASGIKLLNDLDVVDGAIPNLGAMDNIAQGALSLYSLDAAFSGSGSDLSRVSSTLNTVNYVNQLFLEEMRQAGTAVSGSLSGQINGILNGTGNGILANGTPGVLPALGLINAIKNDDPLGMATSIGTLINPAFLTTGFGIFLVGLQLLQALTDEPPEAWGTARFRFTDATGVGVDAAGESFGINKVNLLMMGNGEPATLPDGSANPNYFPGVLGTLQGIVDAQTQLDPDAPLGIIPQRMPTLTWREARQSDPGYSVVEIDPLTGQERFPGLRYNDDFTPFNADATDPAQARNLFQRLIESALERNAIAPLWEVQTARLQQDHHIQNAGSTEEERAAKTGNAAPLAPQDPAQPNAAQQRQGHFKPITLDVNGDGRIAIVTDAATDISFDWDDSGYQKQVGWVGAQDGFLYLDRNANGAMDSGRELFSNGLVADAAKGVRSLAWVDANGDGLINQLDPVFNQLRVWQDANQDGQTYSVNLLGGMVDQGELKTLGELGITELAYTNGRFTRGGQQYALQSPELEASNEGVRLNLVRDGIRVQYTDGSATVFVTEVADLGAGNDGVTVSEDGGADFDAQGNNQGQAPGKHESLTITFADLLANDGLNGSNAGLTIGAVGNASIGQVELDSETNTVRFLAPHNFTGTATFDYTATTDDGLARTATVHVTVTPVNDRPVVTFTAPKRDIYGYGVLSREIYSSDGAVIGYDLNREQGKPFYQPYETVKGRAVTVSDSESGSTYQYGPEEDTGIPLADFQREAARLRAQQNNSGEGAGLELPTRILINDQTYEFAAVPPTVLHDSVVALEDANDGRIAVSDVEGGTQFRYELVEGAGPLYGRIDSLDETTGEFVYTGNRFVETDADGTSVHANVYTDEHARGEETHQDSFMVKVVDLSDPTGNTYNVEQINVTHFGPLPRNDTQSGGKKPIAIDLNGDGFHFTDVDDSNVFFDVNGDGWRRRIAWNNPQDGFIAYDKNGDGKIDSFDEISFVPYKPDGQTDLEGLRAFDTSGDGLFSAADEKWASFGVWQDADSDGVTDPGEFQSMTDLGIQSIGLTSDGQFQVIDGQSVHGTAAATRVDGSTLAIADVTLRYTNVAQTTDEAGNTTTTTLAPNPAGQAFTGTADKDLVFGTIASDSFDTGDGDDVVLDDGGNDDVRTGAGGDQVYSGADDDFVDAGAGNDVVFSGAGKDVVFGGDGDDMLVAEGGNDVVFGGAGHDFISLGEGNDVAAGNLGDDRLFGEAGWDALFGKEGDDELWGGDGNDQLDGGDGNDLLAGGAGDDTMGGGAGSDTYEVDSVGDVVLEAADGGIDTVRSSVNYVVPAGVENLILTGTAALHVTGDEGGNALSGNAGANRLHGNGGDDTLDGGATGDSLWGGDGNDHLYGGDDSLATLALGNGIGQGEFGSYGGYSSYGSSVLTANNDFISGGAGDDWIDGGTGNDYLNGADGNDTILGGASLGSPLLNNDYIIGGTGDDTIDGGSGYDRYGYWRGDGNDRITDTADGGFIEFGWGILLQDLQFRAVGDDLVIDVLARDTMPAGSITLEGWLRASDRVRTINVFGEGFVQTPFDLEELVANLPPFAVSDSGTVTEDQAQVTGNVLANDSDPNGAMPLEVGNVGSHAGAYGTLVLAADGSYTYALDNQLAQVQALAPGQELVESFDVVIADSGSPPLTSTSQLNITIGGTNDVPVLITALPDVQAKVLRSLQMELPAEAFGDVDQVGALTWTARLANGEPLPGWMSFDPETRTLSGVPERALAGETYEIRVTAVDSHGAWAGDVFAVTLDSQGLMLAGTEAADTLTGTELDDTLEGGAGADTMSGGAGDDTYILDRWDDQVLESPSEGIDTVHLTSDFAMQIVEEVFDDEVYMTPVPYLLPDGVENLELAPGALASVTGNSLDNKLTGNEGENVLDGGIGADLMIGGYGDDFYLVDNVGDVVVETADSGLDTVVARIDYTLGEELEQLTLEAAGITGTGNGLDNYLFASGGGNVLDGDAGNDVLFGGDGDDVLIATEGDDVLFGGAGNDTYVVDSMPDFEFVDLGNGEFDFVQTGDFIAENEGEGVDLVRSSVTYSLAPIGDVENLTLEGTAAIDGTGDEHDNVLTGNQADNTLDGDAGNDTFVYEAGGGQDTLIDGSGEDTLRFGAGLSRDLIATRIVTGEEGDRVLISILDASGTDQAGQGIEIRGTDTIEHFAFEDGGVVALDDLLADTAARSTGMAQAASARNLTGDTQMRPISPWMAMHSALSLIVHRQAGWDSTVDETAQPDRIEPILHLLSSGGRKSAGVGSISSAGRL